MALYESSGRHRARHPIERAAHTNQVRSVSGYYAGVDSVGRRGRPGKRLQRLDETQRDQWVRCRDRDGLLQYEYEGDATGGYNPNCKLWSHLEFDYSVDLYDAADRIAIEVEKSKRKNVSDDLLKFQKGHRTQKDGRPKIEFGCLVVPMNYLGRHNLYQHSLTKLDFMKGVLFIDDVAVIGYRDPRTD